MGDVLGGVRTPSTARPAELDVTSGIIVCVLRHLPASQALPMLEALSPPGVPLLGIGLDSSEVGFPPGAFREAFDAAAAAACTGSRTPARRGRRPTSGRPSTCWALSGSTTACAALEDPALVGGWPATRCHDGLPDLERPAPRRRPDGRPSAARMLDAGLMVTVNSDDPAYFGGYVDDNYAAFAPRPRYAGRRPARARGKLGAGVLRVAGPKAGCSRRSGPDRPSGLSPSARLDAAHRVGLPGLPAGAVPVCRYANR